MRPRISKFKRQKTLQDRSLALSGRGVLRQKGKQSDTKYGNPNPRILHRDEDRVEDELDDNDDFDANTDDDKVDFDANNDDDNFDVNSDED